MKTDEEYSGWLLNFLCEQMNGLAECKITYHELMAFAAAARQMNNTRRLDLDIEKFKSKKDV
jgi:hypothetical protein